jgi:hypothetical protein
MIANQVVLIRSRNVTGNGKELGSFYKVYIDPTVTNQLYVINLYTNGVTYDVVEYQYGNLASAQRVQE